MNFVQFVIVIYCQTLSHIPRMPKAWKTLIAQWMRNKISRFFNFESFHVFHLSFLFPGCLIWELRTVIFMQCLYCLVPVYRWYIVKECYDSHSFKCPCHFLSYDRFFYNSQFFARYFSIRWCFIHFFFRSLFYPFILSNRAREYQSKRFPLFDFAYRKFFMQTKISERKLQINSVVPGK